MVVLKVHFTDFWPTFNYQKNYFTDLLNKIFEVKLDNQNPDLLIYSVFGTNYLRYNCSRLFFTGENIRPDFKYCDYALSFDYEQFGGRNYRLPLYALYDDVNKLLMPKKPEEILKSKTGFCNFVYSNVSSKKRIEFFKKLSKYKKVDSGGRVMNNLGYRVGDKMEFISRYKFTISFENESAAGYTTEKIFEPMLMNSVPIYWGNPFVSKDFNNKAFLSYHDFSSEDQLIERIIELDRNDEEYIKMLSQPWFSENKVNEYVNEANILNFLNSILSAEEKTNISSNQTFQTKNLSKFRLLYEDIKFNLKRILVKVENLTFAKVILKIRKKLGI